MNLSLFSLYVNVIFHFIAGLNSLQQITIVLAVFSKQEGDFEKAFLNDLKSVSLSSIVLNPTYLN